MTESSFFKLYSKEYRELFSGYGKVSTFYEPVEHSIFNRYVFVFECGESAMLFKLANMGKLMEMFSKDAIVHSPRIITLNDLEGYSL